MQTQEKISINEFLADTTKHDSCYNFYDWFCKDASLKRRMESMIPKLRFLVNEGIIDGDTCYFWLKNNCPVQGSLYDDLRISRISDNEFLGGFCPKTGHNIENKCSVWTLENGFKEYDFKNWMEFKKEIKRNKSFKQKLSKSFV